MATSGQNSALASDVRQTVFFDSCRGVFQGGGCRAAALAGAYRAAKAAGMHFTAVAGTSAGSILAALVGAGADPDWIVLRISELKFKEFLVPPEKQGETPGLGTRAAGWFAAKFAGEDKLNELVSMGGFYSSKAIEAWVNKCLDDLLPEKQNRIAQFQDLVLPTFVVATDLSEGRERVWGSGFTDSASVAHAVRASCSIPGFFQPVMEGSTALVDGGLLSNLPAFVYAKADKAVKARSRGRILAFQLVEKFEKPKDWGLKNFGLQLANTVVSGATELQAELHGAVHPLRIPTGDVKATDFEKMSDDVVRTLIKNGEQAVQAFVASEATQLRGDDRASVVWDQDEIYSAVVYQAETLPEKVMIAHPDTRWYWDIFPTILYLRLRGVQVCALVEPVKGDERERKREATRRANAAALGVDIVESATIPFSGYCFSGADPHMLAAIVHTPQAMTRGPKGTIYRGLSHEPVIQGLQARLEDGLAKAGKPAAAYQPKLEPYDEQQLAAMLRKGVGQYSGTGVRIGVEMVKTDEIRPITQLVRAFKYRQAIRLAQDFKAAGLPLFGSVAVTLSGGQRSVMGPPVVEIHGDRKIGIEGNSRTYYCYREGIKEIACVVVRGVTDELPGDSIDLKKVNVIEGFLEPDVRMPGFKYHNFRRIEGAVHPLLSS